MNMLGLKTEKVLYEFEGYRVDPVRRRIVRAGEPVPLTPKAFAILLVLLERRGEVVEKEELIQRVWPDTYVTEANLTQNISSLRKALGERAQDSRFVVTIPGQGYSFVADVIELPREATGEMMLSSLVPPAHAPAPASARAPEMADEAPPAPEPAPVRLAVAETTTLAVATPPGPVLEAAPSHLAPAVTTPAPATAGVPMTTWGRLWPAGLALLLLAVALPAAYFLVVEKRTDGSPTLVDRRSIAVLPLQNLSRNGKDSSWLSTALTEMMITELSADPNLRVVSGDNVSRARLSLAGTPADSPETLDRLHRLLGADLVVAGSYLVLSEAQGDQIRLDLRVLQAPGGDTAASVAEVGPQHELFALVSRTGAHLRKSLGLSDLSPEQAMSAQVQRLANTDATRLYAEGLDRLRSYDSLGARDLLQRAAAADPSSALIHSALSKAWADTGYDLQAAEEAQKALALAASLPRAERLSIEARYREAKREWPQAAEIYRSLWTFFPDELEYGLQLAHSLAAAGRGQEAKKVVAALRQLPSPEGVDPRIDLAEAEIAMTVSDHPTQIAAADEAAAKGQRLGESQILAQALESKGDALVFMGHPRDAIQLYQQARSLFLKASNRPAAERLLTHLGIALEEVGDLEGARRTFEETLAAAQKTGNAESIAVQQANLGILNQNLGDVRGAQALLEQAYETFHAGGDKLRQERVLLYLAAVELARGGAGSAQQRLEQMSALARSTDNRTDQAGALAYLGVVRTEQGALREALRLQDQAIAISRSLADRSGTGWALSVSGDTLVRMGSLNLARHRYEEALELLQRVGQRLFIAQVYGGLSHLAYQQGRLADARSLAERELAVARAIGARPLAVLAFVDLSRVAKAEDDLPDAQEYLEEALNVATELDLQLSAATVRLELAELALAQQQPQAAADLARQATLWYRQQHLVPGEARALALLAEALRRQDRLAEAQQVCTRIRALAEHSEDLELRVAAAVQLARVGAAAREVGEAFMQMRQAVDLAQQTGLVAAGLEARLALGTFQLDRMDRVAGQEVLEELRREARALGFRWIEEHAAAALAGAPHTPVPRI